MAECSALKHGGPFDEFGEGVGWMLEAVGGEGEEGLDFGDGL